MGVSLGWLAVALAASGPGASPQEAGPQITYRFQTVEVKGLGWREAGLKPVAQHGSVSVWTAPEDFLDRIPGSTPEAGPPTEIVGLGRRPAHVTTRKAQDFVTRVVWKGKGKAPKPVVESVRQGLTATVVGRRIDQGVLTQLVVEDVDVRAVHTIATGPAAVKRVSAEVAAPKCPFEAKMAREAGASVTVTVTATMDADKGPGWHPGKSAECKGESDCCKTDAKADESAVRAGWTAGEDVVQIPEVGRASAAGEWLIPDGEVLVVGFGPHTVADAEGKAVVREHLAVIAAEPTDEDGPAPIAHDVPPPPSPDPALAPKPAATTDPAPARIDAPRTAAALPELPGRTLPQPINPDGSPAPLPTVPEDEAPAEAADESAEALATPQTRRKSQPQTEAPAEAPKAAEPKAEATPSKPKVEAKAIKTSFSIPGLDLKKIQGLEPLGSLMSSGMLGSPFQGAQFLVPLKPLAVKLPFNQKMEFELIGRIVSDPESIGQFVVGN